MSSEDTSPQAAVLGRILLLQSTLHVTVGEEQLAHAVCRGLQGTPGVGGCAVCIEGQLLASTVADDFAQVPCSLGENSLDARTECEDICPRLLDERFTRLPLATGQRRYGTLLIEVSDEQDFVRYEPYLTNTANLAALHIENQRHAAEVQSLNEGLEGQVRERTAELRKANESLRFAQFATDHIGEEAFWIRSDGRIIYANEAASRILGYSREEILGLTVADIDPLFPVERWPSHWQELRELGFLAIESIHRTKDGRDFPVDVTSSHVEFDGEEYICAFARNITKRKRAEEELAASEMRSRAWLSNSTVCTKILDLDFNLQYMSDAGVKGLNLDDVTQLYGKPYPFSFYPDSFNGPMIQNLEKAKATGETINQEGAVLDVDGTEIWFHSTIVPVMDDQDQIEYIMVISVDITDRKRAQEDLNRLNAELEQRVQKRTLELSRANESLQQKHAEQEQAEIELKRYAARLKQSNVDLQQFAYIASHDLQEPLRAVAGFSELLDRRYTGQLDAQADSWIQFIVQGSQRMHKLVADLLDYSRVDSHAKPFAETDCHGLFDEVVANLHSSIQESGARVTRGELPTLMADESQLTRLVQNLVSNAIKFRGDQPAVVEISAERQEGHWLFRVRDNGIGIDAEYQKKVFEVFRRLHAVDEYPGTGIGLAVCRKVVLRHGGHIWIESEGAGHGCCVCFTIPEREVGTNGISPDA